MPDDAGSDYIGGGILHDRYGRKQFVLRAANAVPVATDVHGSGTVIDSLSREHLVIAALDPAYVLNWGDTNLYRSAADFLKTDDNFIAGLNIFSTAHVIVNNGDGSGRLLFGSAQDTGLYRRAANVLKTDSQFETAGAVLIDQADAGGKLYFGSSIDTNLYRSAADTLKSDDVLWATAGMITKTKAGIPSDSDLPAGGQQSGCFILDTTNSRIYFRVGSTWKFAALT